jgi:hypothetical protein
MPTELQYLVAIKVSGGNEMERDRMEDQDIDDDDDDDDDDDYDDKNNNTNNNSVITRNSFFFDSYSIQLAFSTT